MNFNLFRIEVNKNLNELKNYRLDAVFNFFSSFIVIIGIFYLYLKINNQNILQLLIGLLLWDFSRTALHSSSYIIREELVLGTLQQILLSKTSLINIINQRIFAEFVINIILFLIQIIVCIFLFNIKLDFNVNQFLTTIPLIIITIIGFIGLGYFFSGLCLIFKKATSIANLLYYALLFFTGIIFPIDKLPVFFRNFSYIFPITWMNQILSSFFNIYNYIFLTIQGILYPLLGYLFFKKILKFSLKKGSISSY